jgi:transposase
LSIGSAQRKWLQILSLFVSYFSRFDLFNAKKRRNKGKIKKPSTTKRPQKKKKKYTTYLTIINQSNGYVEAKKKE